MKQENLKSIIIISIIVMFAFSSTYAYLKLTTQNANTATGEGGCFEVDYTGGDAINQLELKSTNIYTEGAHTQMTLNRADNCEIYTEASIYLHRDSSSTAAFGTALKYKILSGGTEVESGSITSDIVTDSNALLVTVPLTTTATTYDIYIWVDPTISNGTYNNKTFSGYLYASAIQTSTIK